MLKDKIKARIGPLWWYAAVMFCIQRVGDLINIYTGLWLVPKWVPPDQLGALLPLAQIGGVLGLPLGILLIPFTKYLNAFGAREETGKVKALLSDALVLTCLSAFIVTAYTWYSAPFVFERLRIGGAGLIWLLCGIAVTSAFMPVLNNTLQALKSFRVIGHVGMFSAPIKLVCMWSLLPIFRLHGFFTAQFIANLISMGISFLALRKVLTRTIQRDSYRMHLREMWFYTLPVAVMMGASSIQTTAQLLIIRQRLPDVESAAFYFCSRFSEIPSALWSAIAVIFFPLISEAYEKGRDTRRVLFQVLLFSLAGGAAIAVSLGAASSFIFGMVEGWREYKPYAYLVGWLSLINVFRVGLACFTTHEMACRRFGFIYYLAPLSLVEAFLLVTLTGYTFFTPYVPASWVNWMGTLRAARLEFIVGVMFVSAMIQFSCFAAHFAFPGSRGRFSPEK